MTADVHHKLQFSIRTLGNLRRRLRSHGYGNE